MLVTCPVAVAGEPIQLYNSWFANECSLCGGVHTQCTLATVPSIHMCVWVGDVWDGGEFV